MQDSRGALQDAMNQGGIPRYFPQLDPGLVKYKVRLMTSKRVIKEQRKAFAGLKYQWDRESYDLETPWAGITR